VPPALHPGVASEFAAWEKADKAQPAEWKVAALQGYPTFINVFATWCGAEPEWANQYHASSTFA